MPRSKLHPEYNFYHSHGIFHTVLAHLIAKKMTFLCLKIWSNCHSKHIIMHFIFFAQKMFWDLSVLIHKALIHSLPLLCNILLYKCITVNLPIFLSIVTFFLICFTVSNSAVTNVLVHISLCTYERLWEPFQEGELLEHGLGAALASLATSPCSPRGSNWSSYWQCLSCCFSTSSKILSIILFIWWV